MTFREFDKMNISGNTYRIIIADRVGYLRDDAPVEAEADRNVCVAAYGRFEVVGFSAKSKNKTTVYIKVNG